MLINYDLFKKICVVAVPSQLLQPGPLRCGISGNMKNDLGKTQVSTSQISVITECIVRGMSHDCVIGYPELIAAKAVMNIAETKFLWKATKLPLVSYTFRAREQLNIF